jgi:hypothetical protein
MGTNTMTKFLRRVRTSTKGPALFALVFLISGSAAANDMCASQGITCTWPGYSASNFPAKPSALVFPHNVILSASTSIRQGTWDISFGPNVAAFFVGPFGPIGMLKIEVRGLQCTNSVVGQIPCTIGLLWHPEGARYCELDSDDLNKFKPGGLVDNQIFGWNDKFCPIELRL